MWLKLTSHVCLHSSSTGRDAVMGHSGCEGTTVVTFQVLVAFTRIAVYLVAAPSRRVELQANEVKIHKYLKKTKCLQNNRNNPDIDDIISQT